MIVSTILLQAGGGMDISTIVMMAAMILVFYFIMIRPQQKKAKDQKVFREELKTGMNVVTIGGLHGKIASLKDDVVTLEVERGMKLTFERSAISLESSRRVQGQAGAGTTTSSSDTLQST